MISGHYNVDDWGAVGDGVSDDTKAIQGAIDQCQGNGGGVVLVPPGTYKVNQLIIVQNVTLVGFGANVSILKTSQANQDVIRVTGGGVRLTDLGFDSFVPRVAGSYVNFTATSERGQLDHFLMEKAYTGVILSGPDTLYVEHGIIRNNSVGTEGSCSVLVSGGQDQYIAKLTMNNEPDRQPFAGIWIRQTGNVNISDCDLMHCGHALTLTGGFSIYVRDSFFDSSMIGILINAQTPVQRCHFSGCWSCGHMQHGVLLDPSSPASIDSISFVQQDALLNKIDGVHFGKGTDLKLIGSNCCENGSAGVAVGHLARQVLLTSNKLGSTESLKGNAYGCFLVNGCDYLTVSNNNLLGNFTQNLAGLAAHQIINNNFI